MSDPTATNTDASAMSADTATIHEFAEQKYKWGFETDI